jgi:3,2-trans-enoyl-CoA isomerase
LILETKPTLQNIYNMSLLLITHLDGGIVEIQLNRPKANAINHEMVLQLAETYKTLAIDDTVKGVYLIGQSPFFSAGLDVIELFGYDENQIKTFWFDFANMVKTLASFPKPFVSAISGHSPAGGCVLALCADYRIMQEGKFKIGLNEVAVGVVVPNAIFELYSFALGSQQAYQALMSAKMFTVEEAKNAGLVHLTCKEEALKQNALAVVSQLCAFETKTWQTSKQTMRARLIDTLEVSEESLKPTLKHWWSKEGRGVISGLIQQLSKK